MPKEIKLSDIVINTYPSEEAYEKAKNQGLLKDDEMHLIEGDEIEFLSNMEIEALLKNIQ